MQRIHLQPTRMDFLIEPLTSYYEKKKRFSIFITSSMRITFKHVQEKEEKRGENVHTHNSPSPQGFISSNGIQ